MFLCVSPVFTSFPLFLCISSVSFTVATSMIILFIFFFTFVVIVFFSFSSSSSFSRSPPFLHFSSFLPSHHIPLYSPLSPCAFQSSQYFSFHLKQHLTLHSLLLLSPFLPFSTPSPHPLIPSAQTRCSRADNIVWPKAPRGHTGGLGQEKMYENHISNGGYSEGIFLLLSFEYADAFA